MAIYYSASKQGFFPDFMKAEYQQAGNWADDLKEISERWFNYLLGKQNEGKVIVPDEYGLPVLANPPEPTQAELINQAEATRAALMVTASAAIAPLEDADELGIATDDEKESLTLWKRYRVMLNRLDMSAAPSIEWPELPV
ncbi:tail fiber assembly protein [Enterobacter sichuanensis]|uniref:tail fiber assembly protein n=1 Tax=Enterobacter sichuanensis TaxID=2071710 RepID=UPI0036D3C3CA